MAEEVPTGQLRRRRRRRRSSGSHRSKSVDRLAQAERLVAIAAAAAAVFLIIIYATHAGALWRDEVRGVNTAGAASLADVWRLSAFESVPFSWLLVLRTWLGVGLQSDAALRVLGVIGGLAVPAAAWFALRRLTRTAPIVSMALIAMNPEIVRWLTTVRPWGIGAALGIFMVVLVREASVALTRRRIVIALVVSVVAVQCTWQNALILAAIVIAAVAVALARRRWQEALVPAGIGAVALLSLLPYVGLWTSRDAWSAVTHVPVSVADVAGRVWQLIAATGPAIATCWLAVAGVAVFTAVQWTASPDAESVNRSRRGVATYAVAALLLALALVGIASIRAESPVQPWNLAALMAMVVVAAEVAAASAVEARSARIARVTIAVAALALGAWPAWTASRERQTNVDAVAARIATEAGRDDLIVVNPWFVAPSFMRYNTAPAAVVTVPPMDDLTVLRFDQLKGRMTEAESIAAVLARVEATLQAGHAVWVVGGIDVPPAGGSVPRLPPAPHPDSGWQAAPYERAWSLAVGAFLETHAAEGHEVITGVSGGRFETVGLAVLKGWK